MQTKLIIKKKKNKLIKVLKYCLLMIYFNKMKMDNKKQKMYKRFRYKLSREKNNKRN